MQPRDNPYFASRDDDAGREGYTFEGFTDPTVPLVELETLLARPPAWRKRRLQIGILLAALLVTLLTFWNVLMPRPPGKTATAASVPSYALSIVSNVNYGTVTINGRQQAGSLPMHMALRSTTKLTVTLDAPPFRPITCSVPAAHPTPPGAFNPCVLSGYSPPDSLPVVALTLLLGVDALSPPMQRQVIALLLKTATNQEASIVPGSSHVAMNLASDGAITSQLTTAPLQASASIAPIPPATLQGDPFCDERLCYAAFASSGSTTHLWSVSVPVALRWRFSSTSGNVFSEVSYPVIEGWQVDLTYAPAAGWQAPGELNASSTARQFSSLSCVTGAALLQAQAAGWAWTIRIAYDAGIQGCQLVSQQEHEDQDAFVWRFGVLLAADAQAQSILPALPLALPAERAAVEA